MASVLHSFKSEQIVVVQLCVNVKNMHRLIHDTLTVSGCRSYNRGCKLRAHSVVLRKARV